MANIVELQAMSNDKLNEKLENGREEMFNLRFQQASARLQNPLRMRQVRREQAQLQTVLHQRGLAISAAVNHPAIAAQLSGKHYESSANYVYEEGGWQVSFKDGAVVLATAVVNLNGRRPSTRKEREQMGEPQRVVRYTVA